MLLSTGDLGLEEALTSVYVRGWLRVRLAWWRPRGRVGLDVVGRLRSTLSQ